MYRSPPKDNIINRLTESERKFASLCVLTLVNTDTCHSGFHIESEKPHKQHHHLDQMPVEGVPPEDLVLAVSSLVLHLALVLLLLLTLLHYLQKIIVVICNCN